MSTPSSSLPNTNPQSPSTTPPVQPSQGNDSVPPNANPDGDGNGAGQPTISLETLEPNVKAFVESELAKARRSATTKAKKDAEEEAERLKKEAAEKAARDAGNFEALLRTETENHTTTKTSLAKVTNELRKIKAAIKAELPDPLLHFMRILDNDDDDAMFEDAKLIKTSFAPTAHRDPATPPATPDGKGGKHQEAQTPAEKGKVTQEKVNNEVSGTKMYSRF